MDRVSLVGLRFYAHIREVLCALARTQIECYICTPMHLLLENHIMKLNKVKKQRKLFLCFRKIIYILGFGFQESNLVRELLAVVCDVQLFRRLGILD